jgi:hypothetical protein
MLNAAPVGIQEGAMHPMPPSQPRQLFKSPASVPQRPVCIQPPMHPMLVALDPSPCVRTSNTAESEDDLVLACMQSFQRNHAYLASKMALPDGNVIVEAPHTTTAEQGGPSNHMQPMHETILARDTSTPPLQVVPPTIPSRASTRSKSKNAPQSSLGPVAPFIANLRGQAVKKHCLDNPQLMWAHVDWCFLVTLKGLQRTTQTMAMSVFLLFVHFDELGVQERMGLKEMSRSKPSELKAPLDLLKTKQRPRNS